MHRCDLHEEMQLSIQFPVLKGRTTHERPIGSELERTPAEPDSAAENAR